jgi:hypothetical protein
MSPYTYLSITISLCQSIYLSFTCVELRLDEDGGVAVQTGGPAPVHGAAHVLLCLHCHPPIGVYRGAGQVSSAHRTRRSATTLCPFLCVTLFISRFFC